jgi:phosphoribosylformylglycinamidine synthase
VLIAEVNINLKRTISDPQGQTVRRALESLGFEDLADVRMGKSVVIRLNSRNKKKAEAEIDQMCRKLLANPIIEEYSFKIKEQ